MDSLLFVSYHPGSLNTYNLIRENYIGRLNSVLLLIKHPYVNADIIEFCNSKFDNVILLPDLSYDPNFFRGFRKLICFLKYFQLHTKEILEGTHGRFFVVSDFSAYLPVNAVLSRLRRSHSCGKAISIREDYTYRVQIDFLKSFFITMYVLFFRLSPVLFDSRIHYRYLKEPLREVLRIYNPNFQEKKEIGRTKFLPSFLKTERRIEDQKTIIIYGDTTVYEAYGSRFSIQEYSEQLKLFFAALYQHYDEFRFVYKPHPQDQQLMSELEGIPVEVYRGGLTSQLHLDEIYQEVRACYSVASTSLLYSSFREIPSYTFYNYLGFENEYPRVYFENDETMKNPFLVNIVRLDQIGGIDLLQTEKETRNTSDSEDDPFFMRA
jgi:hypothetical protein